MLELHLHPTNGAGTVALFRGKLVAHIMSHQHAQPQRHIPSGHRPVQSPPADLVATSASCLKAAA
jgi:hypothetical protein